jgi:CheY-like chemotaxis protein
MTERTCAGTVLYAEDEPDDIFFMRRAFSSEGIAGYLRCVTDGGEVIAYLQGEGAYADRTSHPMPVLVLLDLNLPVCSGFDVLSWIRSQAHTRDLPVIVFSSSGHGGDRTRAQQLGATDYLLKPSSGLSFLEAARCICDRWLIREVSISPSPPASA